MAYRPPRSPRQILLAALGAGLIALTIPVSLVVGVAWVGAAGDRWWAGLDAGTQRRWGDALHTLAPAMPGLSVPLVLLGAAVNRRRRAKAADAQDAA